MNTLEQNPAASLSEEHTAALKLMQLLQQEQDQLVAANIDGLTQLSEEKSVLVARMATLAKKRHDALAASGFEPQESGMNAWLTSAATKAANTAWKELLSLARSAKEINRTNGLLITTHLARNQGAINALRAAPQGNNFYGPDGQSTTRTTMRGLVIG